MNKQTQEALKMAIEALQNNQTYDWKGNPLTALDEANEKVINACKEALAEAEKQEPVAIVMEDSYGYGASLYKRLPLGTKLYTHPAQPLTRDWIGTVLERADKDEAFRKGLIGELAQPLSDDEIYKMADDSYILVELIQGKGMVFDRLKFARAIEQASRSKNDKSG